MTAPARLLSVRLQGFKSFADRTQVAFGPGISAVVGPNGSGKSNLADALRWALGEQGRALRSRKSEDVIWAGSERRPAVGMADVQLTLDNEDGLLPVEFGVVELGRRLYRSGENDYLLNRQRVRLKDLVDLLDAGHLAENAFLFIGQGMVDQALALRPEERRPLFEEVAGVRRHERRRRRAEEQLGESEANLARVDDILAELRPQARRLAQQAEQQANRLTAADELAGAILLSAHARWHAAAARADVAGTALATTRGAVDAAMAELLEHERAIAAAGAALASEATAEAEARTELDRLRSDRASLQLRESRHGSDLEAIARERARLDEARRAAESDLAAGRTALALPLPTSPAELEGELAALDADLAKVEAGADEGVAAAFDGLTAGGGLADGLSAVDAAAVRRLEAARAQELAAARRRAASVEAEATDEERRSARARSVAEHATADLAVAARELEAARTEEASAGAARDAAATVLAVTESAARAAAEAAAGARAGVTAAKARHEDARRALEAAEGGSFSRAARARGSRAIGDGLIVEPGLQATVDAALASVARAHVLPRSEIPQVAGERGVAIPAEALGHAGPASEPEGQRLIEAARARGGGPLAEAIRRDDPGAVTRLLARTIWLPDAAACLELQPSLPAGWIAVARDGSLVAGEVATWLRPDGRDLHLRGDVERLSADLERATAAADAAEAARHAADGELGKARLALAESREAESRATAVRRRAEEVERAATATAETAGREATWIAAQAARLRSEANRIRAAIPEDPALREGVEGVAAPVAADAKPRPAAAAAASRERRIATLRRQRAELAAELDAVRAARLEGERGRARAEAAIALAERQLESASRTAADLAEREAHLASARDDLAGQLAAVTEAATAAEAGLATVNATAADQRGQLRAAEVAASTARERVRIAQERTRLDEREDVEARLALESLREQLLVELAGLGATGLRHLGAGASGEVTGGGASADGATPGGTAADGTTADGEADPEAVERSLAVAAIAWRRDPPPSDPPTPGRLASLRRRFHDLGAVNPFAADEYAEVRARLDGLEGQRTDLQAAMDHTRELIRELDRLIADQFRRTFEALERAFDRRFQQLFGGGFARLSLTDPTDLTATGVEITARPPGKKPQALAMLSGGERALTAVALLFAMLEVRPVPFCVLDEVDAALDEANIGRFTDALRELARTTQCVVITHNRGTIEIADALYGVTVGDDSVSRVISLRLDEATALAGRPKGHGTRLDRNQHSEAEAVGTVARD